MKITLNGKEIVIEENETILSICKKNNINIPTLCYHPNLKVEARCRICMVEMDGKLVTSCSTKPKENSTIVTDNEHAKKGRQMNMQLLKSSIPEYKPEDDYEVCNIYDEVGFGTTKFDNIKSYTPELGDAIIRDNNKCINCGRCVQTCAEIQGIYAIDFRKRGYYEHIAPYGKRNLSEVPCIKCGQCIMNCPVGAISERSHIEEVEKALNDPSKHVVAQTAPSIRAALGEVFGMEPGTLVTGKMVASLRNCGFDKVFDVNLGADITIMEESSEFLRRVKENGTLPLITTCCPGWILMMEYFYPELMPHMSTCKSPHEMLGSLIKNYYAEKAGIKKEDIVVVSVMPCTAKKFESTRPELNTEVDYVLTTRELGRLIKRKKIDFLTLQDDQFDNPLGIATGAAAIFGASGGVMEAALRTAYEMATGKSVTKLEFEQIRGVAGIKEGSITVGEKEIRFAVASGGTNIKKLLEKKDDYHFIEMMACPSGCIGGGGQPLYKDNTVLLKRMQALYQDDKDKPLRKSHENPIVKKLYEEYLGEPLSERSEQLLHTYYTPRGKM